MAVDRNCVIFAGLGGTMPTLCKLASTYATNPDTDPPRLGLYIGLLLFFAIGSILASAFSESDLKKAFIIGVSAPGIITNISAGVSEAYDTEARLYDRIISTAYATEIKHTNNNILTAQTTNPTRKIIVDTYSNGSSSNETKYNFMVAVKDQNQQERIVGIFGEPSKRSNSRNSKFNNSFELPTSAKEIVIYAKGFAKVIPVPNNQFTTAKIALVFYAQTKNDFLWAIGAKREFEVTNIDAYFTSFEQK